MSIRFDADEYLSVSANFPQFTALTIAGFATRKVDTGTYGCLAIPTNIGASSYVGIYLDSNGDDLIAFGNAGSTSSVLTTSNDAAFFFALTSSGVGGSYGYMQARVLTGASLTKSASFSIDATLNAVDRFRVGSDGFGSYFNGEIETLFVWDRVLTDAELLRQSRQRQPIDRVSLRYWLPMMDPSDLSNNMTDYSGNGYNFTNTNSPVATTGTRLGSWRGGNCRC